METILELSLFLPLFLVTYIVLSSINSDKVERKIERLLGKITNKNKVESSKYEYLKKNKKTIRDNLNNLINDSDIKKIVHFVVPEILIVFSIGTAVLGFYILRSLLISNILVQIEGAVLGFMMPYLYLYNRQINIENSLSKETIRFINKGIAICENTNVLIKILKDGSKYSHGKMKEILNNIISSLEAGIDKKVAFNNEINKISNRRLKELLTGLQVASIEDSSYKEVFLKSKNTNEKYFSIRGDGEVNVKNAKDDLFIGLVFAGIVFIMMFVLLKESKQIILNTIQGQLSVFILGILIIYVIYFFIKMKKFNY